MTEDPEIVELLGATEPGKVVMVTGRPGAGVSTTLARAVARWAKHGNPAVMASWERPANALRPLFPPEHVEVFDILGWSVDEFERRVQAAALPVGTLVAVDYLQLVSGDAEVTHRLAKIAHEAEINMLLGAMAPRAVQPALESGVAAALALRSLADAIGSVRGANAQHIHRLAEIVEGESRRQLVMSHPAPNLRMVHSTAWLE